MTNNCPDSIFSGHPTHKTGYFLISQDADLHVPYQRITTDQPCCITLIDMQTVTPQLFLKLSEHTHFFLTEREQEIFSRFSYEKRKQQWLGGRLAAKISASQLLHPGNKDMPSALLTYSILPGDNDRPELILENQGAPTKQMSVSISHSESYCVGMVAKTISCGIDVQVITDKVVRVKDRFLATSEETLLNSIDTKKTSNEKFTFAWSVKEAVKKGLLHHQPSFLSGITIQKIDKKQNIISYCSCDSTRHLYKVISLKNKNYYLSYTTGESQDA